MRRARRAIGRRKELDPEDALRQLLRSTPARSSSSIAASSSIWRPPARARCLQIRRDTIGYVSQFLRTVPRVSALDVVAEPLISLGEDRDAARARARELLAAPQPARKALEPAARHLLRRRAAARQHRARLHHAASGAAARRADRFARRRQPRGRRRPDRREEARGRRRCSASSTTPTCARRSPTGSSTSPTSRPGKIAA